MTGEGRLLIRGSGQTEEACLRMFKHCAFCGKVPHARISARGQSFGNYPLNYIREKLKNEVGLGAMAFKRL